MRSRRRSRTGKVNNAYSNVFDTGVNGQAARRDRATMTEEATGPIRGPVRILASPVRLDALGDPYGKPALVAASFSLTGQRRDPDRQAQDRRHTELTFAYESGRWRVTAYKVTVRRSIAGKSTSTTARVETGNDGMKLHRTKPPAGAGPHDSTEHATTCEARVDRRVRVRRRDDARRRGPRRRLARRLQVAVRIGRHIPDGSRSSRPTATPIDRIPRRAPFYVLLVGNDDRPGVGGARGRRAASRRA